MGGMNASLMLRLKELEQKDSRLKKVYADAQLRGEVVQEASQKSGEAVFACRDGQKSFKSRQAFSVSLCRSRYIPKLPYGNTRIAALLLGLTQSQRNWGFGLCFLYLRNVKSPGWNHKRVYRIYQELELNLRIEPRSGLSATVGTTICSNSHERNLVYGFYA